MKIGMLMNTEKEATKRMVETSCRKRNILKQNAILNLLSSDRDKGYRQNNLHIFILPMIRVNEINLYAKC